MYGIELVRIMKKRGWMETRVHGSHHVMVKDGKTEIIPCHNKDMPKGLEKSIRKRIGL